MEHTASPTHTDMPAATVATDESLERRVDELEAEVERLREALRALEARLG